LLQKGKERHVLLIVIHLDLASHYFTRHHRTIGTSPLPREILWCLRMVGLVSLKL